MKILLVSYFFAPFNNIGSVRTTKLAEYWMNKGYDVKVITADNQPFSKSLKSSFPSSNVIYTNWINVNGLPEIFLGGRNQVSKKGYSSKSSTLNRLGEIYKTIINFPDGQIGWYPFAVKAGRNLIREGWTPDLIYASAHPLTSLLVARNLSSKFKISWVSEFRDLWTDNTYYPFPKWRKWIEQKIERYILLTASATVTVSERLAEILYARTALPGATILNGFDPQILNLKTSDKFTKSKLNISYTGMIYPGKRDPTPLFLALKLIKNPENIKIHFFGRSLSGLRELIDKYDVAHIVSISDAVSYEQSLKIQLESDVLLLLLWNNPGEVGVYTGKLFEYIGARHPILAIGAENGVAADLIKKRNAGFLSNDPNSIALQLNKWIELKTNNENESFILPESSVIGLSREEQFLKLDQFLIENKLLY